MNENVPNDTQNNIPNTVPSVIPTVEVNTIPNPASVNIPAAVQNEVPNNTQPVEPATVPNGIPNTAQNVTPNNGQNNNQIPEDKSNNVLLIVLLLLAAIGFGGYMIYDGIMEKQILEDKLKENDSDNKDQNNNNQNNNNNNDPNNNNNSNPNNENKPPEIKAQWNGLYKSNADQKYYILLYTSDNDGAAFNLLVKDKGVFNSITIEPLPIKNTNEIDYNDTFFDDTQIIKIKLDENTIMVEASSSDKESLLNELNGSYTRVGDITNGDVSAAMDFLAK